MMIVILKCKQIATNNVAYEASPVIFYLKSLFPHLWILAIRDMVFL